MGVGKWFGDVTKKAIQTEMIGDNVRRTIETAQGRVEPQKKTFGERRKESIEYTREKIKGEKICVGCGRFVDKVFAVCSQPDAALGPAERILFPMAGKHMGYAHKYSQESFGYDINILCEECAKKCKKCGKYFCPEHLKKHKCI